MAVADALVPLVEELLGAPLALRLRAWDGSLAGPTDAAATIVVRRRRALRRLLWAPHELGLARAYVAGDLDVEGDLFAVLRLPTLLADRPAMRLGRLGALARLARLGALGPPPPPPPEESRLVGGRHSLRRDRMAISHHYDVGNDFYRLVLGENMTYSCAYWERPAYTLEDAQRAKCALVARKLGLRPGQRLLDVGCGWGSMVIYAAGHHDVSAVGVTLSQEQAELARKRVAEAGLSDRVEIRLQDYRDVDDGPYDAIASVGMAEHVGAAGYPGYAAGLYRLLRPRGRLLNHQITQAVPVHHDPRTSFLDRYVFPDGELLPLGVLVRALEEAGLEVRDVESLREHYGLTLRAWVANLQAAWPEAVRLTSPGRARVWRLYMAGSAVGFQTGRIAVHQVFAVRPDADGVSGLPSTREQWLAQTDPTPP